MTGARRRRSALVRLLGWPVVGALLALAVLAPVPGLAQEAPGNNGTVKIHEGLTETEPIVRNEPHVCTFHLHFFFGDDVQSGDWWITAWPPNGSPSDDPADAVLDGSYDASGGEDRVPDGDVFELPDGHYKLFWEGAENPGGQVNIKHKVFWVECEDDIVAESEEPSEDLEGESEEPSEDLEGESEEPSDELEGTIDTPPPTDTEAVASTGTASLRALLLVMAAAVAAMLLLMPAPGRAAERNRRR